MSKQKRVLTRSQVLAWRESWSYTDRQAIGQALAQLPDGRVTFEEDSRQSHVVARIDDKAAFGIAPGYVWWPQGTWCKEIDHSLYPDGIRVGRERDGTMWATLSTFNGRSRSKTKVRSHGTCDTCWQALPATGICDNCLG